MIENTRILPENRKQRNKQKKYWKIKMIVVPTAAETFGTISKKLDKRLFESEIRGRIETFQTTALQVSSDLGDLKRVDVIQIFDCSDGWGCRIHRLLLCRGVRTVNDGEVLLMQELWGIRRIPLLPSLPGLFWFRVVDLDRVLSVGQIELNCVLIVNWIGWFETVLTFKLCTYA